MMTRCVKCIMPVEKEGMLCEECETYVPETVNWEEKEVEFKELVDAYRGKGIKYDFIVPMTGGKDSSFVLYYMTKVLGESRVLAYTWDNDLIRDSAWANIKNVVAATGVNHKVFKWDSEKLTKLLQSTYKAIGRVCFCPNLLTLNLFPFAIQEKIPLIITGFSEGQREMDHSFRIPDQATQKEKFTAFYKLWEQTLSRALGEFAPQVCDEIVEHILSEAKPYRQADSNGELYPVMVPLSNYVNWTDMKDLQETLGKHVNYTKASDAFAHTSCIIEPIKGYLEYQKEATEVTSEISHLIRSGAITRQEGLEDLTKMCAHGSEPDENTINDFCDFIDITKDEFYAYASGMRDGKKIPKVGEDRLSLLAWIMGIGKFKAVFK